jgi:GntR family transcriptional regulator
MVQAISTNAMDLYIDFNSNEAIYMQIINQIILGIATERIRQGDSLPSVRQMADEIGINMHTVNKAYSILKQEGFLKLDRRRGAVVWVDVDKLRVLNNIKREMAVTIARGICNGVNRQEAHTIVDELYDELKRDNIRRDNNAV